MEPDDEDDRALDAQVDGQTDKCEPDQPQRSILPFFAYICQLPENDRGSANLNQAVQPESGKGNGSGLQAANASTNTPTMFQPRVAASSLRPRLRSRA